MLLGNYQEAYLKTVKDKISGFSSDYDAFYDNTMVSLNRYVNNSVQSRVVTGLSKASGFLSKTIRKHEKEDSSHKVSDSLGRNSENLMDMNISWREKTLKPFGEAADAGISLFTDRIDSLNHLANEEVQIAFDQENLYVFA